MGKTCLAGICLLALFGCATQQGSAPAPSSLRGKTLAVTARPQSTFEAVTPGRGLLIGATQGFSSGGVGHAGAELVAQNQIEDPAPRLAQDLLKAAQDRQGLVAAGIPPVPVHGAEWAMQAGEPVEVQLVAAKAEDLTRAAAGADLLLDVVASGMIAYRFPNLHRYDVRTRISARIIDVGTGRTLVQRNCERSSHEDPNPPSYDELVAQEAARLKAMLAAQRAACFEELEAGLFGIGP